MNCQVLLEILVAGCWAFLGSAGLLPQLAFQTHEGHRATPHHAPSSILSKTFLPSRPFNVQDTLPREARATALRRVGKTLVAAMPEAATRVIAELCIPPAGAVTSSRGRGASWGQG